MRLSTGAALVAILLAPGSLAGPVPLQPSMLPDANVIVSATDNMRNGPILSQGEILSRHVVTLRQPGQSQTVSIGGLEFSLGRTATFWNIRMGQSQADLMRAGDKIRPQVLPLPDGRRYALALGPAYGASLYMKSGMVMSGRVAGDVVSLFDDDLDGFYTTSDTYATGGGSVYARLADHILVGGKPHRLAEILPIGTRITLEAYTGPTARLAVVSADQTMRTHVAFASDEAKMSFALQVGSQPVEVIPGTYTLQYGLAYSQRLRKVVAGVTGTPQPLSVELAEGANERVQVGAPYRIEIDVTKAGRQFKIQPRFTLLGVGGERYVGFTVVRSFAPTVSVNGRRVGSMAFT